jgi:hypothetical protein
MIDDFKIFGLLLIERQSQETFEKCFPPLAGFKFKEGDPALAGLTTGIH